MKKSKKAGPGPSGAGYAETFGGKLRSARQTRNLPMRSLAKSAGRTVGAVWQWEHNQNMPDAEALLKLQALFPELQGKVPTAEQKDVADLSGGSQNSLHGLERLGSKRLRLLADIVEQRERLADQLQELSKSEPTRPKR